MCGRMYSTYTEDELIFRYLNRKHLNWEIIEEIPTFSPNYNICPTQTGLVFCAFDGKIGFRTMRWGLVPSWAKSVKDADKYSMINAKSEEITEKRSYKSAFQKRRCIIPISGFFEWKRSEKNKIPYAKGVGNNMEPQKGIVIIVQVKSPGSISKARLVLIGYLVKTLLKNSVIWI